MTALLSEHLTRLLAEFSKWGSFGGSVPRASRGAPSQLPSMALDPMCESGGRQAGRLPFRVSQLVLHLLLLRDKMAWAGSSFLLVMGWHLP